METKNWYCIYTKSHCEDNVARYLRSQWHIETLSPKLKTRKYVKGRTKEVVEPLFPCYIFSRFDSLKFYHMIKYTRGIRRVIGDECGNPNIVAEDIISQIQSRIDKGFIHVDPPDLNEGDHVVIQGGTLKGFTGIFQKKLNSRDRVMILLSTISFQASVGIERVHLARV